MPAVKQATSTTSGPPKTDGAEHVPTCTSSIMGLGTEDLMSSGTDDKRSSRLIPAELLRSCGSSCCCAGAVPAVDPCSEGTSPS